jgi:monoamine oxidase
MAHKEERSRAAEVADRTLLIADYEAQLAAHASEIQALREELEQRTSVLQAEMDRWGVAELVALRVASLEDLWMYITAESAQMSGTCQACRSAVATLLESICTLCILLSGLL